ncbi:MAG: hypothetical protein ABR591_08100 [Candidatus Velthaea sp.]
MHRVFGAITIYLNVAFAFRFGVPADRHSRAIDRDRAGSPDFGLRVALNDGPKR